MRKIKELTLEITRECLNKCIYCSSMSSCETNENVFDIELIKEIIHDAYNTGMTRLNISGGEPFLHPNIIELINYVCNGLDLKEVVIYTSGVISETKDKTGIRTMPYISLYDKYIDACRGHKNLKLIFNMQAKSDTLHGEIINRTIVQRVRDESISKAVAVGINVEVNVVPMKANINELELITERALSLGCQKVNFLGLVMQGRANEYKDAIVMTDEDQLMLDLKLKYIRKAYGDNKIRIGSPLSDRPSDRCYAGKGRIVVRYDGNVFPCEAFKFMESATKGIKEVYPDNVKYRKLSSILSSSHYLDAVDGIIRSFKEATCKDCPAQQFLHYECAYDPSGESVLSDDIKDSRDSGNIFKLHMKSLLADSEDMVIRTINNIDINREILHSYLQKNYICLNNSVFKAQPKGSILTDKENGKMFAYACDPINIKLDLYTQLFSSNMPYMVEYKFEQIEEPEYILYPEPIIFDDVDELKLYEAYLASACVPDKDFIKHSIALASSSSHSRYKEVLSKVGFKEVGNIGIFTIYAYITPNIMCRKNILNFDWRK